MGKIQWFPGHMAKARREVIEKLKLVDIVIEVVDARLPKSSQNPMLDKIIQQKPRLVLLNKADLADPEETKKWQAHFEAQGMACLAINAQEGKGIKQITPTCEKVLADKIQRRREKGMKDKAIRAMIIGIPNVGKSTVLNRLIRKNVAKTGNKPGVTKAQQWLKIDKKLELLDTPGILWPKFEEEETGYKLALTGAIKDDLLHFDDIALFGLEFFDRHYHEALWKRYAFIPEEDRTLPYPELLMLMTEKRGFRDDYERMSKQFIQDVRTNKLGRYTLDWVEENENN